MNIVFYARRCGLGNNGGSRTILKSVQALEALGHRADVLTEDDKFTWFKHKPVLGKFPKHTDIVIAVSANDVVPMHAEIKSIKTAWWIRGWEQWQMPKSHLFKKLRMRQINICNSSWIYNRLKSNKITSHLVYAGLDINDWVHIKGIQNPDKITIGCLYNPLHKTKRWDLCNDLRRALGTKYYQYRVFGAEVGRFSGWKYVQNPQHEVLNNLYSYCHMWFAPTELEGFHNVPAEAGLCGSLIVANSIKSGGMTDYCNKRTAMMFSTLDDAVECIKNPDYTRVSKMQKLLKTKIGSRETNMKKLIEVLQNGL